MKAQTIHEDLAPVVEAWNKGDAVRVLAIGHTQRMMTHPGEADRIDTSRLVRLRQTAAYEWVFLILNYCQENGVPESFEMYSDLCDQLEAQHKDEEYPLSAEELVAAESLAWKILMVGWKRALAGHEESMYVELKKPNAN